jgi:hypothetical protein
MSVKERRPNPNPQNPPSSRLFSVTADPFTSRRAVAKGRGNCTLPDMDPIIDPPDTDDRSERSPGLRAIYDQLEREATAAEKDAVVESSAPHAGEVRGSALDVALRIDAANRSGRPDGWRRVLAKERVVNCLIHEFVTDAAQV